MGLFDFLKYFDKHSYGLPDKKPAHYKEYRPPPPKKKEQKEQWKNVDEAHEEWLKAFEARKLVPQKEPREKQEVEEAEQKQQTEELKKLTERLDELEQEVSRQQMNEKEQKEQNSQDEDTVAVIVQENGVLEEVLKRLEKLEKENEELKRQKGEKTNPQTIIWPLFIEEERLEEITIHPDLVLALPEASSENREIILFKSENSHPPVPYDRKQDFERISQKIHPERAGFFKALTNTLESNLEELKEMKTTKYQMTIPLRFKNGKYYLTRFIRQFGNQDNIEIRMQKIFEYEHQSLAPKLKIGPGETLINIPKYLRIQAFEKLLQICEKRGIDFLFSETELESLKCANAMDKEKLSLHNIAKERFLSYDAITRQTQNIKKKAIEHLGSYPFGGYRDVIKFWEEQGLSFG
jgi:23S rRNA maturation mini-RNase III